MKTKALLMVLALGASTWFVNAQNTNAPADGQRPPAFDGGPGGPDGGPRRGGFHLLPPQAGERLNLTADQQKQIAALEADVKAKLAAILTADQMKQLEQMRPPRPGGRPGGGYNGGQGGPGDRRGGPEDRPGGPNGGPDGQGGPDHGPGGPGGPGGGDQQ
jgi:hypothetical protein